MRARDTLRINGSCMSAFPHFDVKSEFNAEVTGNFSSSITKTLRMDSSLARGEEAQSQECLHFSHLMS